VKLNSDLPFRGRAALEAQRAAPLPRQLAGFTAASDVILLGRETIYRNGERVGWLASSGYGHTVGRAIGYGYVRRAAGVDADFVLSGDDTLEVAGEPVPAKPFLEPPYDPTGTGVRA
jgi:sarcosine dehydrogenase